MSSLIKAGDKELAGFHVKTGAEVILVESAAEGFVVRSLFPYKNLTEEVHFACLADAAKLYAKTCNKILKESV